MPDIEENNHHSGEALDLVATRAISAFTQTTSRRGLLAAGGKLLLRLLGVSLIPLLPFDRAFGQLSPPTQNCKGDWQYCGQHGNFCKACCGQGAAIVACPVCTNTRDSWHECCCCPGCNGGNGYNVHYVDCCGTTGTWKKTDAQLCKGDDCRNTLTFGWWCGTTEAYYCTIVTVDTSKPCSHCKSTH